MDYKNILTEKINEERESFRLSYADKNSLIVYDDWYKISFYEEYYGFLTSDFIEHHMDVVEWLCQFENPLAFLYEEWLSCDDAFNGDWDIMFEWLNNLYWEEIRNK